LPAALKALVVTKHTNWDLHGNNLSVAVKRGIVDQSRLDQLEVEHTQHQECIRDVLTLLESKKVSYKQIHRRDPWPTAPVDVVITVGGDGTFLTACHAKLVGDPVFIGVCSTDASVGYLCGYTKASFSHILDDLEEQSFKTLPRVQTVVEPLNGPRRDSAGVVNDILFSSPHPSATLRYRINLKLEGRELEEFHKSSGVWISTSAGSTAAISASGGRQQPFCKPTLQYAVRERYKRAGERAEVPNISLFDPDRLQFTNLTQGAILSLDGRRGEMKLDYGDKISFSWSMPLRFLSRKKEHD
jgi:NAD+ kinase